MNGEIERAKRSALRWIQGVPKFPMEYSGSLSLSSTVVRQKPPEWGLELVQSRHLNKRGCMTVL
jgi:hypothetical protein